MSRIFFLDANAIYSYYGRDKLGFNSKPVDEKALRRFLLGKELSLPTSVLIEVITPNEYISIHKKLFVGIYGHAGKLRDYNITKKEWVLNGATVLYGSASELRATLD